MALPLLLICHSKQWPALLLLAVVELLYMWLQSQACSLVLNKTHGNK
jgi:hypothetical protein